jgi:hypothetical protein
VYLPHETPPERLSDEAKTRQKISSEVMVSERYRNTCSNSSLAGPLLDLGKFIGLSPRAAESDSRDVNEFVAVTLGTVDMETFLC